MKRTMLMLLVVLMLFPGCSLADNLVDYEQEKHNIPEQWTKSFDTVNGVINIDTPVTFPHSEALPIYEVSYHSYVESDLTNIRNAVVTNFSNYIAVEIGNFSACVYPRDASQCGWLEWDDEATYAENATVDRNDILRIAQQTFASTAITDEVSFRVDNITAHGRTWLVDKNDKAVEPLNEHGYYDVALQIMINGISVQDPLAFYCDTEKSHGPHAIMPQMRYYDSDNYSFYSFSLDLLQKKAEDIRILPFKDIVSSLEAYIVSGHLREIYRVELSYILMWSDDYSSMLTVPAWVVWGYYEENAERASNPSSTNYYKRTIGGYPIIIPAVTGVVVDWADKSNDRWLATKYLPGVEK